jgi:hypothetical protein
MIAKKDGNDGSDERIDRSLSRIPTSGMAFVAAVDQMEEVV